MSINFMASYISRDINYLNIDTTNTQNLKKKKCKFQKIINSTNKYIVNSYIDNLQIYNVFI